MKNDVPRYGGFNQGGECGYRYCKLLLKGPFWKQLQGASLKNRIVFYHLACLLAAGALLLGESLLGCFFVLGIGLSSWDDLCTDLCLTMAFPIFLLSLRSIFAAAVALWLFFGVQWLNASIGGNLPGLVNPFGWLHGDLLFAAASLVTISWWKLPQIRSELKPTSLIGIISVFRGE